jgi:uncharacterized protein (TIGR03000 family)
MHGGFPPLVTSGGVRGGFGAPGYRGGLNNSGFRNYSSFYGMGVPYYGGLGYPYGYPFGGMTLGFGVGGLGYGYGMGSAYGYNPGPPPILAPQTIPVAPVDTFLSPAAAVVDVAVPAGAKVWFNDKEAEVKDGAVTFTSEVLKPGQGPTLHLKARWDDRDRDMYLTLRAGDKMTVDLRKN